MVICHLSSGSWTCTEYSNQHKDTSAAGLSCPSDLPNDVCTWLRQQRLLLCLPVPSRWGGTIDVNHLCPFHSLTQHCLPCTWPVFWKNWPVWYVWHQCAGRLNWWMNARVCTRESMCLGFIWQATIPDVTHVVVIHQSIYMLWIFRLIFWLFLPLRL